jgi:hypothetical protein
MLFGKAKANIIRMKLDSASCSSLPFIFNIPCPPLYDIIFFLEPPVEHSFMAHGDECTVLSMMCLRRNEGGGGGTKHIDISGYLHIGNIDSETCYVRLPSLFFHKPQGIWKCIHSLYTTCGVVWDLRL